MSTCSCYSDIEDDDTQSFWKRLASKYERRIRKLTQTKRELTDRLEVMQLQMPACLYRNMMRAPEEAKERLENFMKGLLQPEEPVNFSNRKCTCDPCPIAVPSDFPKNLYDYKYTPTKTYVSQVTKSKPPVKISDSTLNKNLICNCKHCTKVVLKRLREEKEKAMENNYEFLIPEKLTSEDIDESNTKDDTYYKVGDCTCCANMFKTSASACECKLCAAEVIKRIQSPDVVFEPFQCGCDGFKKSEAENMEGIDIPICQCNSCKIELNRRMGKENKETDKNSCFCGKNVEIDPSRLCDCDLCADKLRIRDDCPCNEEAVLCSCDVCNEENGQKKEKEMKINLDGGCICDCEECAQILAESLKLRKVPSAEPNCICACDECNEARQRKLNEDDVCSCESDEEECVSPSLSESCECSDEEKRASSSPSGSCECSLEETNESKTAPEDSKGACVCFPPTETSKQSSVKTESNSSCVCSLSPKESQQTTDKTDSSSSCACSLSPSHSQQSSDNVDSSSHISSASPSLRTEPSTKSDTCSLCKCSKVLLSNKDSKGSSNIKNLNVKNIVGYRLDRDSTFSCQPSDGRKSSPCSGTSTPGSLAISKTSYTQRTSRPLSQATSIEKRGIVFSTGINIDVKDSRASDSLKLCRGHRLDSERSSCRSISSSAAKKTTEFSNVSSNIDRPSRIDQEPTAAKTESFSMSQAVSDIFKSVFKIPKILTPKSSSCPGTSTNGSSTVSKTTQSVSRPMPESTSTENRGIVFSTMANIDVKDSGTFSGTYRKGSITVSQRSGTQTSSRSMPETTSTEMRGIVFSTMGNIDIKDSRTPIATPKSSNFPETRTKRGSIASKISYTQSTSKTLSETGSTERRGVVFSHKEARTNIDAEDSRTSDTQDNCSGCCIDSERSSSISTSSDVVRANLRSHMQETTAATNEPFSTTQAVTDVIATAFKTTTIITPEQPVFKRHITVTESPRPFRRELPPDDDDDDYQEVDEGSEGPVFSYVPQVSIGMPGSSSISSAEATTDSVDSVVGRAVRRNVLDRWSKKTSTSICTCMMELEYEDEALRPKDCSTDTDSCCCLEIRLDKFDKIDGN